ncbi:MAG: tryptophan 2,3-dioxygenase family protein, partial [Myxococcota bacterium]|nr:tryptophan 2,3-dioxygenase family protein [Myxococcota bacterium]
MNTKVPNYWDYLKLADLLTLQGGLEDDETALETDELHFIITHQSLELWFKLILAELREARDHLAGPLLPEKQVPRVVYHIRRVNAILRLATQTFSVMETLTPQDFLSFRDKLTPASGFQSFQMREIELILGIDWPKRIKYGSVDPLDHIRKLAKDSPAGTLALERIENVLKETSLRGALHQWLSRTPIQGSRHTDPDDAENIQTFLSNYVAAVEKHHTLQANRLIESSVGKAEEIEKKFQAQTKGAKDYIYAEDIEDVTQRRFVTRYRAALIFIESYRDLPLLAWPRTLIDAVVELESEMVMFR